MIRLTDFNPLSINGLFLLNKIKYFGIFFHVTSTHIFLFGLIENKKIKLLVLVLFINMTDRQAAGKQTDRQQSSVLYNLMQMEVFFLVKTHLASVYSDCNE